MPEKNLNQYQLALGLIEKPFETVLDLGCWDKRLKKYLPGKVRYQGLDFERSNYFKKDKEIINRDLEKGLPMFKAKSFDVVFLLEVLQSLNNPHFVFSEALRVAKKGLVVSLFNMYYWVHRLKYLLGRYPVNSMKFFAKPDDPKLFGRHKWVISYSSADDFVRKNAPDLRIRSAHFIYDHKKLKPLNFIEKALSRIWPNLFVSRAIFYIEK